MDKLLELFLQEARLDPWEAAAFGSLRRYARNKNRFDTTFWIVFLTRYLPQSLCRAEEETIDAIYPVAERVCRFLDAAGEPEPLEALESVPAWLLADFARPLRAKAALLRFIESPLLSRDPVIVDLNAYARKKESPGPFRWEQERGLYLVADLFGRDSVVLRRLSGDAGYVRLYLNREVVSALRPQDTLSLTLREKGLLSGWTVEDVDACYAGHQSQT